MARRKTIPAIVKRVQKAQKLTGQSLKVRNLRMGAMDSYSLFGWLPTKNGRGIDSTSGFSGKRPISFKVANRQLKTLRRYGYRVKILNWGKL